VPETACLKVQKNLGEKAIRLVNEFNLFNSELKVQQVDNYLCIPLTSEPLPLVLKEFKKKLLDFEVSVHNFPKGTKPPLKLIDYLADKLPPNLLASVPRAIDFVGDIAIIEIPPELSDH
jgi:tRNA G37 N-methylase Trm5